MIIAGLQKLTLIDYPERIACTIFLYGCNLRCGFCHNPSLVTRSNEKVISEEEIIGFLEKRKKYLDGVCITGGEPLMSLDEAFLKKIKALGYAIKLDTNGCYPERLKELIGKGLVDYVAMDIKAPAESYEKVTREKAELAKIEESIRLVSGLKGYEFRTTFVKRHHSEREIKKIGEWLNKVIGDKPRRFCLQGFRNSGEFVDESFKTEESVSKEELQKIADKLKDYFGEICVRG